MGGGTRSVKFSHASTILQMVRQNLEDFKVSIEYVLFLESN